MYSEDAAHSEMYCDERAMASNYVHTSSAPPYNEIIRMIRVSFEWKDMSHLLGEFYNTWTERCYRNMSKTGKKLKENSSQRNHFAQQS